MKIKHDSSTQLSSLKELVLKPEYRSDTDDLVHDFYVPCLSRSHLYHRAVGYFTSRGLAAAAQGIAELIKGNGRMHLLASPLFEPEDLAAIQQGHSARHDVVTKALLRNIEAVPDAVIRDRLGYLAWLVAEERLEIRIAMPVTEDGFPRQGIYHEKIGIFFDQEKNAVAFTGSPNETMGGLVDNFESIDVFCSWDDPHGRAERKASNFLRLWENKTPNLEVMEFPEAARKQLLTFRSERQPTQEASFVGMRQAIYRSGLWPHQIGAVEAWEANGCRGLVSMATGSGKTLVALVGAERCPDLQLLVVAVPKMVLVDQWAGEIAKHGQFPDPILAYEDAAQWQERLFNRLRAARHAVTTVVVGTMKSISGPKFESVLRDAGVPPQSLIVVDEVHNIGAPTYRQVLRQEFRWRLGLSATPARHFDEEGTEAISEYFGPVVFVYELRHALRDGRLCPYRYFIYPAHLSETEYGEYVELSRRISQLRGEAASGELTYQTDNVLGSDSEAIKHLLFRRARVLKKCGAKVAALEQALLDHPMKRGLIYCADNEQLDEVRDLLNLKRLTHLTYTADTPSDSRRSALESLAHHHIPVLLAIDCLDEGVDVPIVDEAIIIASSSNMRQFIQRRGRILRRAPDKELATLVDIIALPPPSAGHEARKMLNGELARAKEMAELAENRFEVLQQLKNCTSQYGVLLIQLLSGEGNG